MLRKRGTYSVVAKLRRFKRWGEAETVAKARSLKLCDTPNGDDCWKTRRGRVAFRAGRKVDW